MQFASNRLLDATAKKSDENPQKGGAVEAKGPVTKTHKQEGRLSIVGDQE